MSLSLEDIAAVVTEISPVLSGAWLQKVFQPTPHTITLEVRLRNPPTDTARTVNLLISAEPGLARLHVLTHRYPNPPAPPPFCQYLRAHITGGRIDTIEQVDDDRIVRVRLTTREGPYSLLAELTGRHADILLLDSTDHVVAALHAEGTRIGQPYAPPTRVQRPAKPHISGHLVDPKHDGPFPISAAIEQRYKEKEQTTVLDQQRAARQAELRKRIKKTRRQVEALQSDMEKAGRYKDYARYGELLKANLGKIEKGQTEVTVVDYFDPILPELVIPLDPARSAHGNAEEYFKKHRKHLSAERELRPRIEQFERELEALQTELTALQAGEWQPPADTPAQSRGASRLVPSRKATRPARSGPFRRFTSADGLPIYVGRNARENDELTFGLAHSDDLWLHARGTPGSHVVVRLEKGSEVPVETLRDAATLALLYSDLKKSGRGDVIYTRRKYVRKAKGQGPGSVNVTQDKSIFLQLDRTRLQRLKNNQPG